MDDNEISAIRGRYRGALGFIKAFQAILLDEITDEEFRIVISRFSHYDDPFEGVSEEQFETECEELYTQFQKLLRLKPERVTLLKRILWTQKLQSLLESEELDEDQVVQVAFYWTRASLHLEGLVDIADDEWQEIFDFVRGIDPS